MTSTASMCTRVTDLTTGFVVVRASPWARRPLALTPARRKRPPPRPSQRPFATCCARQLSPVLAGPRAAGRSATLKIFSAPLAPFDLAQGWIGQGCRRGERGSIAAAAQYMRIRTHTCGMQHELDRSCGRQTGREQGDCRGERLLCSATRATAEPCPWPALVSVCCALHFEFPSSNRFLWASLAAPSWHTGVRADAAEPDSLTGSGLGQRWPRELLSRGAISSCEALFHILFLPPLSLKRRELIDCKHPLDQTNNAPRDRLLVASPIEQGWLLGLSYNSLQASPNPLSYLVFHTLLLVLPLQVP